MNDEKRKEKVDYKIRSVQLLNYINDILQERLITDPFFQRNLVWRELHKQEFIRTILLGYPFPHIFLSKGKINLEKKISVSSIVDGQQRTNAILEYISDKIRIDGKTFSDLNDDEKQDFYKYEIPVIELDLTNDSKIVSDIFQRINRTSNSLTMIERKSSEYSASEFMQFSEFLSGQISFDIDKEEDDEISEIKNNPYISDTFKIWSRDVVKNKRNNEYIKLINSENIFSIPDVAKKVNLMYTLNLISTNLGGFFNRNDKSWEYAEVYKDDFSLKDEVTYSFNKTAHLINLLKFKKTSIWNKKANFFSLFSYLVANVNHIDLSNTLLINNIKDKLNSFIPSDEYKMAAKEGVNNLKEREIRNNEINNLFDEFFPS